MNSLLEKLKQVLDSAQEGMSEQDMKWHPPGKWCAVEVLEHLYLSYTGTTKGFRRVLEAGKPLVERASLRQRLRTVVVLGFRYLPEGRTAPKTTVPRGLPLEKVKAELEPQLKVMDEVMAQCEARLGRGKVLDHPVLGPLSAAQWRKFHLIHGRHHARQIASLRQRAGREGSR